MQNRIRPAGALGLRGTVDTTRVAHRDAFDPTGAIDEQTDATVELAAERRHLPRQIVAHDLVRRNAAPIQPF